MRSLLLTTACVICLAPLPACTWTNWSSSPKATRTVSHSVDHVPGTALTVISRNGSVDVRASDSYESVLVTATITCGGQSNAEAQQRVGTATLSLTRDTARHLTIQPIFPGAANGRDGASIVVHLPYATNVAIDTSNGGVSVSGTGGMLVIDTSNGAIDVRDHAGPIVADTSNGPVNVAAATSTVVADTSNGGITVELATVAPGPIQLDTSNGPIRAVVRSGFDGQVTMDTSNGPVTIQDATGRVHTQSVSGDHAQVAVGEYGEESRLDTSNGGITLVVED